MSQANSKLGNYDPLTGMKKCDKDSPSIILAGRALLVKMLITLETRCAFGSNFEYFFYYSYYVFFFLFFFWTTYVRGGIKKFVN